MILAVGTLTGVLCLALQCVVYLPAARYFSWAVAKPAGPHRLRTVVVQFSVLMVVLMLGNIFQIIIWGLLYRALGAFEDLETALYFSGVTFTTLGYGDVVLVGHARLLAPLQAANGLMMFGISTAAFIAALQHAMTRWTRDRQVRRPRAPRQEG